MKPTPLHALPDGYVEARHVVLTQPDLLLRLNLYSLVPLLVGLAVVYSWRDFARTHWTTPTEPADIPWLIGAVIAIVGVLVLHEAVHGLVILLVGHRPRFGAKLSQGVLYATADNAYFRRDEFLAVALAPAVLLTLIGLLLIAITSESLAYYIGLAAVFNFAGAIGDLWSVAIIARYPRETIVRDEADGFRLFTRVGTA